MEDELDQEQENEDEECRTFRIIFGSEFRAQIRFDEPLALEVVQQFLRAPFTVEYDWDGEDSRKTEEQGWEEGYLGRVS